VDIVRRVRWENVGKATAAVLAAVLLVSAVGHREDAPYLPPAEAVPVSVAPEPEPAPVVIKQASEPRPKRAHRHRHKRKRHPPQKPKPRAIERPLAPRAVTYSPPPERTEFAP
jgi:hypothetical protein